VIGMGGVASAQDCLEFLAAGASVVGVGTALFRDPGLPLRLLPELAVLMGQRAVFKLGDVIGLAHPDHHKARLEVDVNK
jgi:dihydroorotate dehydrogenase (NAD+) catalytic subunit